MATDIGNIPARTTLSQLGSGQSALVALADAATVTAPEIFTVKHTTSGTAAAGFGVSQSVDLQSGAGTVRRVQTFKTTLTTATDGAEVAKLAISLMAAGTLTDQLTIAAGGAINVVSNGADATPSLTVGSPADLVGIANVANQLRMCVAGACAMSLSSGQTTNILGPLNHLGSTVGFYSGGVVAKYNTTGTATGFVGHGGTAVTHTDTFTGNTGATAYTIGDIVRALKLLSLVTA